MNTHRILDYAGLALLGAIWGGSYIIMRTAGPEFGTLTLIGFRASIAAVVLASILGLGRQLGALRPLAGRLFLLGVWNNVIPFFLITNAVAALNASMSSILNATTPLFAAVVGAVVSRSLPSPRVALGVVLGVVGVAVLVGYSPVHLTPQAVIAVVECLVAALAYGSAAVYVRHTFAGVPPLVIATGQVLSSGIVLLPLGLAAFPATSPSVGAWAGVVVLAVVCTAIAYILYFRLLRGLGATGGATVTFLVPLFSLVWGVLLLGEPATPGLLAGLVIILASVWLVLAPVKTRAAASR